MNEPGNHLERSVRRLCCWNLSLLWLGLACVGCGPPRQYPVTGIILFDGKPAPAGKITFEPDVEKGNEGPMGFAEIKDGKFDTNKGGQGVVAGRIIVCITVGDGESVSEAAPYGKILLEQAKTKRLMPSKPETMQIDIPRLTPPKKSK